jgi:hypothetical protein
MNKDTLAGLGLLAIAIAYWLAAGAIPHSVLSGQVAASALPKLLAGILAGLGLLLTAQGLLRTRRVSGRGAGALAAPSRDWWPHLRALGMLMIAAGYILFVPYLGYILSIALLGAAVALYNGAERSWRVLAISAIGALLFYVLFVHLLKVPLPPGVWPDLVG